MRVGERHEEPEHQERRRRTARRVGADARDRDERRQAGQEMTLPAGVHPRESQGDQHGGEQCRRPPQAAHQPDLHTCLADREAVRAPEKGRRPPDQAAAREIRDRARREDMQERALAADESQRLDQRRVRRRRHGARIAGTALRLLDGEQQHDHGGAEAGEQDQAVAPSERIGQHAAGDAAETRSDGDAQGEHRHRDHALLAREIIGEHRMGCRRRPRLAEADADPRRQELPEALRHAAQRSEDRPDDERPGDHVPAMGPVGQRAERQTGGGVADREGRARQKADAAVGQVEFGLDRLDQGREHEAIGDVDRIDQRHDAQHPSPSQPVRGAPEGAREHAGAAALRHSPPPPLPCRRARFRRRTSHLCVCR